MGSRQEGFCIGRALPVEHEAVRVDACDVQSVVSVAR